MATLILAGACGLIFGLGLIVSGMVDPAKVLGFLDVTGAWDPSLAGVMGGGVLMAALGMRWSRALTHPMFAPEFCGPTAKAIDAPLVGGALLFGIGWGLAGYCPGPALTSVLIGQSGTLIFVGAMVVGMLAYDWVIS